VDEGFTIAFVGHADAGSASAAVAYEDAVLPLLAEHGAQLLYRGRRRPGQSESLPLEVHLIWFPSRAMFDAYLGDPRREALLEEHGETFNSKVVVELDPVVGPVAP
jgi:uncharacterized protein (DUF1330 family)